MSDFDLIVRGGTVVDGTGAPGYRADVAVRGGHIVEIGNVKGDASTVIDASERSVSPGFFDLHTHLDVQVFFDRTLMVSPWHGVTTASMGNCGLGIAPTRPTHREWMLRNLQHVEGMEYATTSLGMGDDWGFESFPEYMDAVDRQGAAINTVAQIGHVAAKMYVVGEEASERIATDEERAQMVAIVEEALAHGAFGFSTNQTDAHFGEGGLPIASRLTTELELMELVSTMKDLPTGIFTMGTGSFLTPDLLTKLVELIPRIHVHGRNPNVLARNSDHLDRIAFHEGLRARGFNNHMQLCVLPMQFEASMFDPYFPFMDVPPQLGAEPSVLMSQAASLDSDAARYALYKSEGFRDAFREATSGPHWEKVFAVMTLRDIYDHDELEYQPVVAVAQAKGVHPSELLIDLQVELGPDHPVWLNMGYFNFDTDEVAKVMAHPLVVPGNSDAGAHVAQMLDARWPAYFLGKFVRERGDFSIEAAVKKMTYDSAESMGISDRGVIANDLWADLVVFDPATITDGPLERRHDFPADGSHLVSEPVGIDHVIVNGTPIRQFNEDVVDPDGPMPGRLLRNPTK